MILQLRVETAKRIGIAFSTSTVIFAGAMAFNAPRPNPAVCRADTKCPVQTVV